MFIPMVFFPHLPGTGDILRFALESVKGYFLLCGKRKIKAV